MTTTTTAADAVSQLTGKLKMLKSSAFAHLDRSRFPHMQIKANTVADLCDEVTAVIATATARESALVAERDALKSEVAKLMRAHIDAQVLRTENQEPTP